MKVIYFILELSFIISRLVEDWLIDGIEKNNINILKKHNYYFYVNLEVNQRINLFISFDSKIYNITDESLAFYELDYYGTYIREEKAPFTKIEKDSITTLVAVYIAKDPKIKYIKFIMAPTIDINGVSFLAKINKIGAFKKFEIDLNNGKEKIENLNEFSSKIIYSFTLTAGYNSYARLELIFDTKNNNYKGFNLSHVVEHQNTNKIFFYQTFTETIQGNKTILTFSHLVSNKSTNKIDFQLIPSCKVNNVNILGFEDKAQNEYKNRSSLDYSLELISMYPSINYTLMYPIEAYQTDQILLRISNITSIDNYLQPVDVYECWSDSFDDCKINETQNFTMTKNDDLTIFLKAYYQNKNDSINHIVFAFNPSYIFYDVAITGSIIKNHPDPTPDSDSGSSSDSAPDSGSSSFSVLISIIISIFIISVIAFFIYFYIKKRRSKDINFDQRDSLGDDFLLNE